MLSSRFETNARDRKPSRNRSHDVVPEDCRWAVEQVLRAEQRIVCLLVACPSESKRILALLTPEHFVDTQCQTFFRIVSDVAERTRVSYVDPADCVSAMAECASWNKSASTARKWLIALARGDLALPMACYLDYEISVLRQALAHRQAQADIRVAQEALAGNRVTPEVIEAARDSLNQALAIESNSRRTADEIVSEVLEEQANRASLTAATKTGLKALDACLCGGMLPGQVLVVAGRPGGGKTSLGLQIALNVARSGGSVYIESLEMRREELCDRLCGNIADISYSAMRENRMDLIQRRELAVARNLFGDLRYRLTINDEARRFMRDIELSARTHQRQYGLTLLVIDYLQLIQADDKSKFSNRQEQVAKISRDVKILARTLNVPVLLLSQLRRADSPSAKPTINELRESGAIEQDADVVMLLHGCNVGAHDPVEAKIIIAKQRNGPLAEVPVQWHGPTMSFRDIVCDPEDNQFNDF